MDNKLLIEVGETLYGPRWQTDLARDIGVSDRTIRRWVAGTDVVPLGAVSDIAVLIDGRVRKLQEVGRRLSGTS